MNIQTHNVGACRARALFLKGRRRDVVGCRGSKPWSPNAMSITTAGSMADHEVPRRAMFTYWGLGLEIRGFTPPDTGRNYTLTPSLPAASNAFKNDCTVLTGLTSFTGGHGSCCCLLTGRQYDA